MEFGYKNNCDSHLAFSCILLHSLAFSLALEAANHHATSSLWRGPFGKELMSLAHSQQGLKAYK